MSETIRRSSRSNKGTHTKRNDFDVYYKEDPDSEPAQKRLKVDSPDPEEGQVRCDKCNTTPANYDEETDEGGVMIECDGCKTWQHAKCMGYKSDKDIPSEYHCNRCEKKVSLETENYVPGEEHASEKPASIEKPVEKPIKKETKSTARPKNKVRANVAKALLNVVIKADSSLENAQEWSEKFEEAIYAWSRTTDKKYIDKSRGVMALLKKPAVLQRLVTHELSPSDLTTLPVEEIDPDLKDYAEKVRQESIRRSVLTVEDSSSQRIRRTHKGEEIVESVGGNSDFDTNESLVAKKVDHRKFESTPPAENIIPNASNVPSVYQIDDDDEETKPEEPQDSDGDSDDELDFILKPKEEEAPKEPAPAPAPAPPAVKIPPTMPTKFWSGEIEFPDFAWFDCSADFVSCTNYEVPKDNTTAGFHNKAMRVCKELLESKTYQIEGRLDLARASPYLEKVGTSRDFYLVKLLQGSSAESYDKVFNYLLNKAKVGVLNNRASFVKDSYVFALDGSAPSYLQFAPIDRGLYVLFVVKKDYVPVGKSILKKSAPVQQAPPPVPAKSLDSILSKLESSVAAQPSNPGLPQKPQAIPQGYSHYQNGPVQQNLPNGLNQDQISYLSGVVQQNPQVQNNPQALLDLLQGMYR